jgi:hypothetical protein
MFLHLFPFHFYLLDFSHKPGLLICHFFIVLDSHLPHLFVGAHVGIGKGPLMAALKFDNFVFILLLQISQLGVPQFILVFLFLGVLPFQLLNALL